MIWLAKNGNDAKIRSCVLPICFWQSVSVTSGTRPTCVASVSVTSWTNLFFWSSSVESESAWLRLRSWVRSIEVPLSHEHWQNNDMKPAAGYTCSFSAFWPQFEPSLGVPLIQKRSKGGGGGGQHPDDQFHDYSLRPLYNDLMMFSKFNSECAVHGTMYCNFLFIHTINFKKKKKKQLDARGTSQPLPHLTPPIHLSLQTVGQDEQKWRKLMLVSDCLKPLVGLYRHLTRTREEPH